MSKLRIAVTALTLSAAGFISIVQSESYTDKAVIPTQGDKPTMGYGSTFNTDGSPIKMGQSTTPVRALVLAQTHISKEEEIFRKSLEGASLSQAEFDLYMDFAYQYGTGAWVASSMRKDILAGKYATACEDLLKYRMSAGYDCATPGNRRCGGVWQRQLDRHAQCMAVQ